MIKINIKQIEEKLNSASRKEYMIKEKISKIINKKAEEAISKAKKEISKTALYRKGIKAKENVEKTRQLCEQEKEQARKDAQERARKQKGTPNLLESSKKMIWGTWCTFCKSFDREEYLIVFDYELIERENEFFVESEIPPTTEEKLAFWWELYNAKKFGFWYLQEIAEKNEIKPVMPLGKIFTVGGSSHHSGSIDVFALPLPSGEWHVWGTGYYSDYGKDTNHSGGKCKPFANINCSAKYGGSISLVDGDFLALTAEEEEYVKQIKNASA